MGTTRIKVIDLSSQEQEIKTSRKHAEKLTGAAKLKEEKKPATEKIAQPKTEIPEEKIAPVEGAAKSSVAKNIKTVKAGTTKKPTQKAHSKKYQEASKLIDKLKAYLAKEALDLLSKTSTTRFDPTVEVHLNVNDKNLKGRVNFPHSIGAKKEKRYLVFSEKKTEGTKNVTWGNQNSIAELESGKLKPGRDFDAVISTPKFMPQLAKVAKILGPRGMMPNPKAGNITDDPAKILSQKDDGYCEFKTDPTAPIIHTKIGKLSAKQEALEENLKALIGAIGPTKIKKAIIKSTMSPAIKLDPSSFSKLTA